MTPPVVAEVSRGREIESRHRGDAAVVSGDGRVRASFGDPSLRIFLRSAAKPFQVLPFLEAGGDQEFGLGDADVALMCSSHGGEPRHVRGAERLLRLGGFRPGDLVCGPHLPAHEPSARALLRRAQRPTRLHNNCSGKHAGLLLACRLFGYSARGYSGESHPVQRALRRRLSELASVPEQEIDSAIDGCGLVVFRLPLAALALAYAKLLERGVAGESRRESRARRIVVRAMSRRPDMVAGTGFFTTEFLGAGRGRWIGKEGAEGVYAVGLSPAATGGAGSAGIALKIEDGSMRARGAVTLAILRAMGWMPPSARRRLAQFENPVVTNTTGATVGSIEPRVPIIRDDAAG